MSIFDILHYLIGLIILFLLVWIIIRVDTYFSKDIIPITSQTLTEQFIGRQFTPQAPVPVPK